VVVVAGVNLVLTAHRNHAMVDGQEFRPHKAWLQIVLSGPESTNVAGVVCQLKNEASLIFAM
jgi:hypothetical protein